MSRRARACKTGYETTTYTLFPIANLLSDSDSHLVLSVATGRGPGPDDPYFCRMVKQAAERVKIAALAADAGYDNEAAHRYARRTPVRPGRMWRSHTDTPTRGRPTTKPLKGYWRQRMKTHFNNKKYGKRWQIESVNSMIKRSMGSALRARTYWSQSREITLRVLTHNIMIIPCD